MREVHSLLHVEPLRVGRQIEGDDVGRVVGGEGDVAVFFALFCFSNIQWNNYKEGIKIAS